MPMYLTVTPAYGRDYKSQKEAKADWDAGKDFQDPRNGQYCSKRDFENNPDIHVTIRYRNLTRTVNVQ